jgi:hypothetical protein
MGDHHVAVFLRLHVSSVVDAFAPSAAPLGLHHSLRPRFRSPAKHVQIWWLTQHNVGEGPVRPSLVQAAVQFSLRPFQAKLLAL